MTHSQDFLIFMGGCFLIGLLLGALAGYVLACITGFDESDKADYIDTHQGRYPQGVEQAAREADAKHTRHANAPARHQNTH